MAKVFAWVFIGWVEWWRGIDLPGWIQIDVDVAEAGAVDECVKTEVQHIDDLANAAPRKSAANRSLVHCRAIN